ncbi:MAG: hypothetical protein ABL907_14865 [Hyphomicrobium sp.]
MRLPDKVRIAGDRTVGEWFALRAILTGDASPNAWDSAFSDYFKTRIQTRYFDPIEALSKLHKKGEGFSIVAIQCCLIEFFGSTLEGKTYRFNPGKKHKLGDFEYDGSKEMFTRFLVTATPFASVFNEALAKDFYEGVRCGLLHEARTKKGWTIRTREKPGAFLDVATKTLWRDDFQRAFYEFVDWYRSALLTTPAYKQAFIRKFDGLCED